MADLGPFEQPLPPAPPDYEPGDLSHGGEVNVSVPAPEQPASPAPEPAPAPEPEPEA